MDHNHLCAFRDYITIKLHFNDPSFKFNQDKTFSKITLESLSKRKDARFFIRMVEKYPKRQDRIDILVSLFLLKPDAWIGEIFEDEFKDYHLDRLSRVKSLKRTFEVEMMNIKDYLKDKNLNLTQMLLTDGDIPDIIKKRRRIRGGISDETLSLLNYVFGFCNQKIENPLWQQKSLSLSKYKNFLNVQDEFLESVLNQLVEV